jgi:hypothetical protein
MAITQHPQCLVCKAIVRDPKLGRRISVSKMFIPGGESLLSISRDYEGVFIYKSLNNHAKKHQAPTKAKLEKKIKAFETKQAFQEIEAVDERKQLTAYTGQAEARKDILDRAMKALDAGDVKLTMSSIVALLGQEQKAEENAKDRGLKMMEMFNYFASGASRAKTTPYQPPIEEAEVL